MQFLRRVVQNAFSEVLTLTVSHRCWGIEILQDSLRNEIKVVLGILVVAYGTDGSDEEDRRGEFGCRSEGSET